MSKPWLGAAAKRGEGCLPTASADRGYRRGRGSSHWNVEPDQRVAARGAGSLGDVSSAVRGWPGRSCGRHQGDMALIWMR